MSFIDPKRARIGLAATVLVIACATGLMAFRQTLAFEQTPGARSSVPESWPLASSIVRRAGASSLLVFAHPYCSCTKATLEELAGVLNRDHSRPATRILFYRPSNSEPWKPSDLWQQAAALPGAEVLWDDGGREAKNFGARTSGLALLYNSAGRLVFQGGVTGSRGHVGDNVGAGQLAQALASGPSLRNLFVFGCSLLGGEA